MKKAILIDVENQKVVEVIVGDGLSPIYNAIGNNCNTFCCPISFKNDDTMYADDEILLRRNDVKGGFIVDGKRVIVNNAIVMGTNEEGESIDCASSIKDIEDRIEFINETGAKYYFDMMTDVKPTILSW
jgi:hypothetical protein